TGNHHVLADHGFVSSTFEHVQEGRQDAARGFRTGPWRCMKIIDRAGAGTSSEVFVAELIKTQKWEAPATGAARAAWTRRTSCAAQENKGRCGTPNTPWVCTFLNLVAGAMLSRPAGT